METINVLRIQNPENRRPGGPRSKVPVLRCAVSTAALLVLIAATAPPGVSQPNPDLQTYFQQDIGLSAGQIAAINGYPVTKALLSRTPAEVFLFGVIYIHAAPEKYVRCAVDLNRLRKRPNFLGLGVFSHPPQLSDLKGFSFDSDDAQSLKSCKPGLHDSDARSSIDELHRSINWSGSDVNEQVNQLLQKTSRCVKSVVCVRWERPRCGFWFWA